MQPLKTIDLVTEFEFRVTVFFHYDDKNPSFRTCFGIYNQKQMLK